MKRWLIGYRNIFVWRTRRFLGRWFYGIRPSVWHAKDLPLRPCWNCGTPTRYYDVDFMAPLCSKRCGEAKWREYEAACKRST